MFEWTTLEKNELTRSVIIDDCRWQLQTDMLFDGQPLLLFWPSTISNTHCLNKHERPLHSEVTSKTQVQMTSFTKWSQVTGHDHGWLLRSLQNIVTRIDRTCQFLIRLFLKILGILIANISSSAHDHFKIKSCFKNVKEKQVLIKKVTKTKK